MEKPRIILCRALLARCPSLRVISNIGVGYDHIDIAAVPAPVNPEVLPIAGLRRIDEITPQ